MYQFTQKDPMKEMYRNMEIVNGRSPTPRLQRDHPVNTSKDSADTPTTTGLSISPIKREISSEGRGGGEPGKMFSYIKYTFVLILIGQIILSVGFLFYAVAQLDRDLGLRLDYIDRHPPASSRVGAEDDEDGDQDEDHIKSVIGELKSYHSWRTRLIKKFLIIAAIVGCTLDMVAIWGALAENRCMVLTYALVSLTGNVMQLFGLRPDVLVILNFLFGILVTAMAFYVAIQIKRKQRVYSVA